MEEDRKWLKEGADSEEHTAMALSGIQIESIENIYQAGGDNTIQSAFILDTGATSHICNDIS